MWLKRKCRISSRIAWQQTPYYLLFPIILQLTPSKAQARNRKDCKHAAAQSASYRLGDVDVDHCCCAEGRRASVSGLDDQRPLAVFLLGDVLHDLHGLDVGLQSDFSGVCVDFERIVRIGRHYGVFDDVVWRFGIFVHCLWKKKGKYSMVTNWSINKNVCKPNERAWMLSDFKGLIFIFVHIWF